MPYHKRSATCYPKLHLAWDCLYLDDTGVIHCFGRIHNAPVTESAKFPYLLPSRTCLLNWSIAVLMSVNFMCWIPDRCLHVKKAISNYVTCKKISWLQYYIPDPHLLPKSRLQQAEPFTATRVDFTGALYVLEAGVQRKVYFVSSHVLQQEQSTLKSSQICQCRPFSLHVTYLKLRNLFLN